MPVAERISSAGTAKQKGKCRSSQDSRTRSDTISCVLISKNYNAPGSTIGEIVGKKNEDHEAQMGT